MKKILIALMLLLCFFIKPLKSSAEPQNAEGSKYTELLLFMDVPNVSSASKQEESINEAPSIISVVSKEEINKFGANNLHDVLERVTSLYTIGQYLNVNGNSSIRGDLLFGQDLHILILLNGRPLRDNMGGYNLGIYEGFPLDAIESIEVVRGPGSVLYGSNAYVGVINIKTAKPKNRMDGFKTSATASGGSFGTGQGSVATDIKDGDFDISGAVTYINSKGWKYTATDERRITRSMDLSKNNMGLQFLLNYKNFSLNLFGAQSENAVMGNISRWPTTLATTLIKDTWMFVDAGYKLDLAESWYAQFDLSTTYTDFLSTSPHRVIAYLGEGTVFGKLLDNVNLTFGSVFEKRAKFADAVEPPVIQNNSGMYLQTDYRPIKQLKLTAGVQSNRVEGRDPGIVPRAGAVINITENLGFKLLYGEAFRSPCMMELFLPSTVLVGNPNLEPERIATIDIQSFFQMNKFQGSITYFNSRYSNMIIRDTTVYPQTYLNGNSVKVNGVELEGKASILPNLNLLGSYTYNKNEDGTGTADVMQISNHMAKLGVVYDIIPDLSLGVFDSYYSKPPDVINVSPTRLLVNPVPEAYHWITLNANYKVMKQFEISTYVTNLMNKEVFYPEFGRKLINSLPGRPGTGAYLKVKMMF